MEIRLKQIDGNRHLKYTCSRSMADNMSREIRRNRFLCRAEETLFILCEPKKVPFLTGLFSWKGKDFGFEFGHTAIVS